MISWQVRAVCGLWFPDGNEDRLPGQAVMLLGAQAENETAALEAVRDLIPAGFTARADSIPPPPGVRDGQTYGQHRYHDGSRYGNCRFCGRPS